jgi:glycine oxidase
VSAPKSAATAVAIAGGGIIGLSLAWRLAQRGFRVSVFDQGSMGGEASWAGAGMLAPGGEIDAPSAFAGLCLESRTEYPAFVRELEQASGISIDYQECGALEVAYSPEDAEILAARAERQQAIGIHSKPVNPDRVAAFWPRLRDGDLLAARFYPQDAIVDPRHLTAALAAAAASLGVVLLERRPVQQIDVSASRIVLQVAGAPQEFDCAVIAAGAWSGTIPVSGVPPLPASEPVKGHLIAYSQPVQTCSTIIRHRHTYLLQRASGMLLAGASVEHAGFDRSLDPAIVDRLAREAAFLLPHLRETTPASAWTGFRPASAELQLGAWHSNRLYLAYGHFRNGILLAPVTASRLAGLIAAA